ncbi:hypothetical protein N2152v2_010407 [Parachlorella kessleri]
MGWLGLRRALPGWRRKVEPWDKNDAITVESEEVPRQGLFGLLSKRPTPAAGSGSQASKPPHGPGESSSSSSSSGDSEPLSKHSRQGSSADLDDVEPPTVFVTGSTGRLGVRIVRELLLKGYRVRAGVRSMGTFQSFVRNAARFEVLSSEQLSRLEAVVCDPTLPDTTLEALSDAERVVCAVGASDPGDTPALAASRVDGELATSLIEAAARVPSVRQFVLVTSLAGGGPLGFAAGLLSSEVAWKRRAEDALERSGLPYVVIRPGSLDGARDDYKLTHGLVLAPRGTLTGGQVSRLQVAELVAACLDAPEASQNKVLEVIAELGAPALPLVDLMSALPQEATPQEREALRERELELLADLAAARERLEAAEARLQEVKRLMKTAGFEAAELKRREATVRQEVGGLLKEAEQAEVKTVCCSSKQLNRLAKEAEAKAVQAEAAKAVLEAAKRAQQEDRLLTAKEIRGIRDRALAAFKAQAEPARPSNRQQTGTVLGGLFGSKKPDSQQPASGAGEAKEPRQDGAPPTGGLFARSQQAQQAKRSGPLGGFFGPRPGQQQEEGAPAIAQVAATATSAAAAVAAAAAAAAAKAASVAPARTEASPGPGPARPKWGVFAALKREPAADAAPRQEPTGGLFASSRPGRTSQEEQQQQQQQQQSEEQESTVEGLAGAGSLPVNGYEAADDVAGGVPEEADAKEAGSVRQRQEEEQGQLAGTERKQRSLKERVVAANAAAARRRVAGTAAGDGLEEATAWSSTATPAAATAQEEEEAEYSGAAEAKGRMAAMLRQDRAEGGRTGAARSRRRSPAVLAANKAGGAAPPRPGLGSDAGQDTIAAPAAAAARGNEYEDVQLSRNSLANQQGGGAAPGAEMQGPQEQQDAPQPSAPTAKTRMAAALARDREDFGDPPRHLGATAPLSWEGLDLLMSSEASTAAAGKQRLGDALSMDRAEAAGASSVGEAKRRMARTLARDRAEVMGGLAPEIAQMAAGDDAYDRDYGPLGVTTAGQAELEFGQPQQLPQQQPGEAQRLGSRDAEQWEAAAAEAAAAAAAARQRAAAANSEAAAFASAAASPSERVAALLAAAARQREAREQEAAAAATEAEGAVRAAEQQALTMREALQQMKRAQEQEAAAWLAQAQQERREADARYAAAQQELQRGRQRIAELEGELESLRQGLTQRGSEVEQLRAELGEASQTAQSLRREVQQLLDQVAEADAAMEQQREATKQARQEAGTLRAELGVVRGALEREASQVERVRGEAKAAREEGKLAKSEAGLLRSELASTREAAAQQAAAAAARQEALVERALAAERRLLERALTPAAEPQAQTPPPPRSPEAGSTGFHGSAGSVAQGSGGGEGRQLQRRLQEVEAELTSEKQRSQRLHSEAAAARQQLQAALAESAALAEQRAEAVARAREAQEAQASLRQAAAEAAREARQQRAAFEKAVSLRESIRQMKQEEVDKAKRRAAQLEALLRLTEDRLQGSRAGNGSGLR